MLTLADSPTGSPSSRLTVSLSLSPDIPPEAEQVTREPTESMLNPVIAIYLSSGRLWSSFLLITRVIFLAKKKIGIVSGVGKRSQNVSLSFDEIKRCLVGKK